jgi:hypothetical protein
MPSCRYSAAGGPMAAHGRAPIDPFGAASPLAATGGIVRHPPRFLPTRSWHAGVPLRDPWAGGQVSLRASRQRRLAVGRMPQPAELGRRHTAASPLRLRRDQPRQPCPHLAGENRRKLIRPDVSLATVMGPACCHDPGVVGTCRPPLHTGHRFAHPGQAWAATSATKATTRVAACPPGSRSVL